MIPFSSEEIKEGLDLYKDLTLNDIREVIESCTDSEQEKAVNFLEVSHRLLYRALREIRALNIVLSILPPISNLQSLIEHARNVEVDEYLSRGA